MVSHPRQRKGVAPPEGQTSAPAPQRGSVRRSKTVQTAWPLAAIGGLSLLATVGNTPTPGPTSATVSTGVLAPVVDQKAVQWWAAFKFNAAGFPTSGTDPARKCTFGGDLKTYAGFSQKYAFASSADPALKDGDGLVGVGPTDPLGSTFARIYTGATHYVVWNDQFYDAPKIAHCTKECGSPWGHSKGMLAWDDAGEGVVLQVTTPSWPGAGSAATPRVGDGNTLGCISDNDVLVSQDFFALRLTKDDVISVLKALSNSSVVTDLSNPQLVSLGGPADVSALASTLGSVSDSDSPLKFTLSSGVQLISKPSRLHVPPWQFVSAELGGLPLKVASWWTTPQIASTPAGVSPACWSPDLRAPGAVEIVHEGNWEGRAIGLEGGPGSDRNHAKIGVSTDAAQPYAVFGDMNQQGALAGTCASSQNGRGGLFYVVESPQLAQSVSALLSAKAAPPASASASQTS